MTRDLVEENGGVNLYCYCANSSIQNFDYLGHETFQTITMKRKHVIWKDVFRDAFGMAPRNNGYYGHWWIEIGSESYGWWPETDPSFSETIFGTPGVLNAGQENDPHAGDKADESFHPRRASGGQLEYGPAKKGKCKCVTEEDVANCIRAFAAQYSGKWSYPVGQNCHSFQAEAMSACCMTR